MSPQLRELWLEHAVAAFGKQMQFAALLGEHQWQWSHSGHLYLRREAQPEKVLSYNTQVLGSESQMSLTWIWIWADEHAAVAEPLMRSAHQLRSLGEEKGIPEFTSGETALDEVDGHILSLLAVGLLNSSAYYCGTSLGSAGFVLIDEPIFEADSNTNPNAAQVAQVYRAAMASLNLDDGRRALRAYLQHLNWSIEESASTEAGELEIIGRQGHEEVRARFDGTGSLVSVETVGENSDA